VDIVLIQDLVEYKTDPDLKPLYKKVLDRVFLCLSKGEPSFTDFYDPAKWELFANIIKKYVSNINVVAYGGPEERERRKLCFIPGDFIGDIPYPITCIVIKHEKKFNKSPRHQDYLGAIIGLGFDRSKIGDIVLYEEGYARVYVCSKIADYICSQLHKAGKAAVKASKYTEADTFTEKPSEREVNINTKSMRLDAVCASVFKLSRGRVQALIKAKKAFVNWSEKTGSDLLLKQGDVVTLRGYGRMRIGEVTAVTKKDRLRLTIYLNNPN